MLQKIRLFLLELLDGVDKNTCLVLKNDEMVIKKEDLSNGLYLPDIQDSIAPMTSDGFAQFNTLIQYNKRFGLKIYGTVITNPSPKVKKTLREAGKLNYYFKSK